MKHTLGPWKMVDRQANFGNDCGINIQTEDLIICRLPDGASTYGGYGFPHQLANARLIAAAPEMLEALKQIIEDINDQSDMTLKITMASVNKAKKIITKAEGR